MINIAAACDENALRLGQGVKQATATYPMFDYNGVAADVKRDMGLEIRTQSSNGASTSPRHAPLSPTRSRANFGRAMPFFIGVAGGTASGKTTVCDCIMQRLHDQCVVMLSQDSFYRGLTAEEHDNAHCE